jgi:hypothetical protein
VAAEPEQVVAEPKQVVAESEQKKVAAVNGKYPKNPPGDGAPPSREPEQVVAKPEQVVAVPDQKKATDRNVSPSSKRKPATSGPLLASMDACTLTQ